MVFRVKVPRWSMRPAKLLIRSPLALRLVAFLARAVPEGSVAATGEDRSARAASRSVSWNNSGAALAQMPLDVIGEHAQEDARARGRRSNGEWGHGADSEEKHEPASDIDTVVADSLKALAPKRPIREADISTRVSHASDW
jgi:hypothetical protein